MFRQDTVLAIIPARGGSKGIKRKNIHPFLGKPLLAHTADLTNELKCIDKAIVSTDCNEIAQVAKRCGIEVPFIRPGELSGDNVADWAVVNHALKFMEATSAIEYNLVVLLQPTSPIRKQEWILGALSMLIDMELDAVWTVSKTDSKAHPLKQLVVNDSLIEFYDPIGSSIVARQQLGDVYHRNGVAYVIRRECILDKQTMKTNKTGAYIINEDVVNIDTLEDIRYGEYLAGGP